MTDLINRLTIKSWNLSCHGLYIEYEKDNLPLWKPYCLNLEPKAAADLLQLNGFIILPIVHDGTLIIRYSVSDVKTEAVEWAEFVQKFKLSQYKCLRIVEAYLWNQKAKKLESNVKAIPGLIAGMNKSEYAKPIN